MSGASVRVEGAAELAALLRSIGDAGLKKANRLAYKAGADVVAEEARSKAPIRTGKLRASIRSSGTQTGGAVVGNAPYTAAIHWGRKQGNVGSPPGNHRGVNPIAGRQFITDAANAKADAVAQLYLNEVMRLFETIGGRRG